MHAKVLSAALRGVDAIPVEIEVDIGRGLPGVILLGLPDAGVKEGRDRIRPALRNSGFEFPLHHVTANLAPAHVRKEGAAFDLPLAIGVLAASGQIGDAAAARIAELAIVGELALDGRVRPSRGALSMALAARAAGRRGILLAADNAAEAAVVTGLEAIGARTLREAVGVLGGEPGAGWRPPPAPAERRFDPGDEPLDFADVRGQEGAKRALVIAAAGGHNVIFAGPPGAGKTMLARRLPTILPDLDLEESFEVTRIASVAGILPPGVGLVRTPPFRAPHHTASEAALVGGGNPVRPGEVTLAHRGVLFLDELPEFGIHKLDTLRQPLEEGCVRIARSSGTIEFPADFICVAAMNPCPCGHAFQEARPCRCPPPTIRRYQSRISGPLRDRFDLQVVLRPVKAAALHGAPAGPSSTELRAQVVRAREAQAARMGRAGARTNAKLSGPAFRRVARVRPDADAAMRAAAEEFRFSARRMGKLLRVARTIADLEGSEDVLCDHVDEALTFRGLEVDLQLETVS